MNFQLSFASRLLILLLFSFAVLFYCSHPLMEFQYDRQSDCGYYYKYARHIAQQGPSGFKDLFIWYASTDEARAHPAPVRVGYILTSAALFKWQGPSFKALGFLATISFLIFLYISFHYVRRYFNADTALVTVLFLASSPLILGLSRTGLADAPINLLWGWSVWLFLDVVHKRRPWSYMCFLIVLTGAMSVKEMTVILIPFFALCAWWARSKGHPVTVPQILGILFWPAAIFAGLCVWMAGGVGFLESAARSVFTTHLAEHHPNAYAIKYSSGPWFRYIADFLLLNPIVTMLSISYAGFLCLRREPLDVKKLYLCAYFVFVYVVLNALPHSKVVRVVVNLEMVMALFAAFMLGEMLKMTAASRRQMGMMAAVFVVFTYNWYSFFKLFYTTTLLDPVTYRLLQIRHFIPGSN